MGVDTPDALFAKGGKDKCTTIQSGTLLASDGSTITTGFDDWGYNYQGNMFKGGYCDSARDAEWCQPYKDDDLLMKWNDAWLSNQDCSGDGKLDRHFGFASYIGSGAFPYPTLSSGPIRARFLGLLCCGPFLLGGGL